MAIFLHKYYSERIYPCLLIFSFSLASLVIPYIIRTTQLSLESLPAKTLLTAVALGATKLQNILYVLIPQSFSGILSGIILAIGRCAEDTAVIMLTNGQLVSFVAEAWNLEEAINHSLSLRKTVAAINKVHPYCLKHRFKPISGSIPNFFILKFIII